MDGPVARSIGILPCIVPDFHFFFRFRTQVQASERDDDERVRSGDRGVFPVFRRGTGPSADDGKTGENEAEGPPRPPRRVNPLHDSI